MLLLEYKPEYTKEYLYNLFNYGLSTLSSNKLKAVKSVLRRKLPYYGLLRDRFWNHWVAFNGIYHRRGVGIDKCFSRSLDGFINLICYLGPIPKNMINPTVGRIDHSKGYIKGNFQWQSAHDNYSEVSKRCNNRLKSNPDYIKFKRALEFYKDNPDLLSCSDMTNRFGYHIRCSGSYKKLKKLVC